MSLMVLRPRCPHCGTLRVLSMGEQVQILDLNKCLSFTCDNCSGYFHVWFDYPYPNHSLGLTVVIENARDEKAVMMKIVVSKTMRNNTQK